MLRAELKGQMPNQDKPKPVVIGKIGSHDVVTINNFVCIQLGKRAIGISKIKMVLANIEACRAFLIKYDVAKPDAPVQSITDVKTAAEAEEKIKALQAMLAKLNADKPAAGRLDPVAQKAA